MLYYGDNLEVLKEHVESDSVDLIYLDPPFNPNRSYNVIFARRPHEDAAAQIKAFEDTWKWKSVTEEQYHMYTRGGLPEKVGDALVAFHTLLGENDALAYLVNMAPRLVELRRVLKSGGVLYLHCDPTMSHYLKILLDAAFGPGNFRNEIIWRRTNSRSTSGQWPRVHDVLLMYSLGRMAHYRAQLVAADPAKMPHTLVVGPDGKKYQTYELTAPGLTSEGVSGKAWRGFDPSAMGRHWANAPAVMEEWDRNGLIHWPAKGGFPRRRAAEPFDASSRLVTVNDVWADIDRLNQTATERVGYPTQKPLALLARIISASSNEGGVVLDPFCGCGTTIDAAQRLGRRWIGIDIAFVAIDIIQERLRYYHGDSASYGIHGIPSDLASADALFRRSEFEFQRWAASLVNAQPSEKQSSDKGVDGITRFAIDRASTGQMIVSVKGGQNVIPRDARDLLGTVTTQKAQMGVMITRVEPSPGVIDAVSHGGTYTYPLNGQTYPKLQVITVRQLLSGAIPSMPVPQRPYNFSVRIAKAHNAARLLAGRVFVHARVTDAEPLLELINDQLSGLILTGTKGLRTAVRLRRMLRADCPVLVDPAVYETEKATPWEPFKLRGRMAQREALDAFIRDTTGMGPDAVLTPTRYIGKDDRASLEAVLTVAAALHPQAVLSLPLDITWLSTGRIDALIDVLASSPVPKAVMLGAQPDASEDVTTTLVNLRRLVAEVPQIALFRAGLAALDATVRGGLAGAIGTSTMLRGIVPPDEEGRFSRSGASEEPTASPNLLVGDLVTYVSGSVLADRFGDTEGPFCRCRHCGGRRLTNFLGRGNWHHARLHSVAVWTDWLPSLIGVETIRQREQSWTRLCQRGIEGHGVYNRLAGYPASQFIPRPALRLWAGEDSSVSPKAVR